MTKKKKGGERMTSKKVEVKVEVLEDFRTYLLESGSIASKLTLDSYLGNTRQLLSWLEKI